MRRERHRTPLGEHKPARQLTLEPVATEASMPALPCSKPLVQKANEDAVLKSNSGGVACSLRLNTLSVSCRQILALTEPWGIL